jgi:hypothetical protein
MPITRSQTKKYKDLNKKEDKNNDILDKNKEEIEISLTLSNYLEKIDEEELKKELTSLINEEDLEDKNIKELKELKEEDKNIKKEDKNIKELKELKEEDKNIKEEDKNIKELKKEEDKNIKELNEELKKEDININFNVCFSDIDKLLGEIKNYLYENLNELHKYVMFNIIKKVIILFFFSKEKEFINNELKEVLDKDYGLGVFSHCYENNRNFLLKTDDLKQVMIYFSINKIIEYLKTTIPKKCFEIEKMNDQINKDNLYILKYAMVYDSKHYYEFVIKHLKISYQEKNKQLKLFKYCETKMLTFFPK